VEDPASVAFSPPCRSRRTLEGSIMFLELGAALHPVVVPATKGKEELRWLRIHIRSITTTVH